jgi:hypothetical protein
MTQDEMRSFYDEAEQAYHRLANSSVHEVILHYAGDLNFGHSNSLSARLEKILAEKVQSRTANKRFFSVFVEAIQNIRIHGEADESGSVYGSITVYLSNNQLWCRFLSFVSLENIKELQERYDRVNRLDRVALKKEYMKIMQDGEMSSKGGAGLGILTIVMRSRNPSPYVVIPLSKDFCIFQSEIAVDLEAEES